MNYDGCKKCDISRINSMLHGAVPHTSPCTCGSQGRPVVLNTLKQAGRLFVTGFERADAWRSIVGFHVLSALLYGKTWNPTD